MFTKKVNVFNGVKILSLLLDLDENKMKVDFIKEFDRETIRDKMGISEETTDPNILFLFFKKYLDENKGSRSLKDYLDDIQDSGFVSPYYSGLSMEVLDLI